MWRRPRSATSGSSSPVGPPNRGVFRFSQDGSAFRLLGASVKLLAFILFATTVFALLISLFPSAIITKHAYSRVDIRRSYTQGAKTLRLLVLGASIMTGSMSTDENGFRNVLRTQLASKGFNVNFVGNRIGGSMLDNAFTAWGGYRIDEVAAKGELSYAYQPNVILIQCGSNDFFQNFQIATAADRLMALVDRIHEAVPDSLVLVGTLLPNWNTAYEAKFTNFNNQVKTMTASKAAAGQKVALVDFTTSEYSTKDIRPPPDGTHPTDAGYVKMGRSFYNAIVQAQNTITDPRDNGIPQYDVYAQTACAEAFVANETSVLTQQAFSGSDSGTKLKGDGVRYCDMFGNKADDYLWMGANGSLTLFGNIHSPPNWKEYGTIHNGGIATRDRVHLADLDGDGRCDYVVVDEKDGTVEWQRNLGYNGTFSWGSLAAVNKTDVRHLEPIHCEYGSQGVQFADTTGDGYQDYLCISPNGSVHAWQAQQNLWWNDRGYIKDTEGFTRSEIRFADVDGNGRADYLGVNSSSGSVQAWTNGNNSLNTQTIYNFTARGTILSSTGNSSYLKFANLGGFGRADAIDVVPETAEAHSRSNTCVQVSIGSSLHPHKSLWSLLCVLLGIYAFAL